MRSIDDEALSELDRKSELILLALADAKSAHLGALAGEAGVDEAASVKYRLEKKLEPEGAVECLGRRYDADNAPVDWCLTDAGHRWVKSHRDELEPPQTSAEAIEVARKAQSTAKQAQKAAGSATNSVSDIKDEFDSLRNEVDATFTAARDARNQTEVHASRAERIAEDLRMEVAETMEKTASKAVNSQLESVRDDILDLREDVEQLDASHHEMAEAISTIDDNVKNEVDRLTDEYTDALRARDEAIKQLSEENEQLRQEIEDLKTDLAALREDAQDSIFPGTDHLNPQEWLK